MELLGIIIVIVIFIFLFSSKKEKPKRGVVGIGVVHVQTQRQLTLKQHAYFIGGMIFYAIISPIILQLIYPTVSELRKHGLLGAIEGSFIDKLSLFIAMLLITCVISLIFMRTIYKVKSLPSMGQIALLLVMVYQGILIFG